jgi:hypothetical protein
MQRTKGNVNQSNAVDQTISTKCHRQHTRYLRFNTTRRVCVLWGASSRFYPRVSICWGVLSPLPWVLHVFVEKPHPMDVWAPNPLTFKPSKS